MGITKMKDVIAWQDGRKFICPDCGDPGEAKPLTNEDFDEGDIVTCDQCHERIL